MEKEMTVKEALAQGYDKYIYPADGWQRLNEVSDVEDIDWSKGPVLIDPTPLTAPTMSAEDIADTLADQMEAMYYDETSSDDTSGIVDSVKEIDFSAIEAALKTAMEKHIYYKQSDIRLVPDSITTPKE